MVEQRLRGQAELACVSQEARVLGLADGIAKRIEREGRWRAVPAPGCPGPSQGAGVVLDRVLADQITHTHTTPLGPSLVAWEAWQRLEMPALLERLGFNAAQALLRRVDLEGSLVTADAMHTQTETARIIVQEKGADYLLTVKGNQKGVSENVQRRYQSLSHAFSP